jgi:hypothetical protein
MRGGLHALLLPVMAWSLGCADPPPLAPMDLDRLEVAEHQWAAREFADYSVDMVHICDCPPSFRDRARIEVVDGTVQRVTLLGTFAVITDSRREQYRTVEDVFRDIRQTTTEGGFQRVTFSVDPVLGIPTYVHWAARPAASEVELILIISNPQPLSSFLLPRKTPGTP